MDPVLVWLVIAAVLFGVDAFLPMASEGSGLRIRIVSLGLMCLAISFIVARS